ncbi:MAG: T9SS type A sorting domain-containing protein, partial [Bacteroidetes bacterium]|nr:T9SS type A sorting domain-containing protein [Bacteroidota bacterium]
DTTAVGFVDYSGNDYHLTAVSPYANLGTDGKDLGADIDSIAFASIYDCNAQTAIIDANQSENHFQIYPNPSNDKLTVSFHNINKPELKIFNALGEEVFSQKISNSLQTTIDISQFHSGIYFIRVTGDNQTSVTQKTVVTR